MDEYIYYFILLQWPYYQNKNTFFVTMTLLIFYYYYDHLGKPRVVQTKNDKKNIIIKESLFVVMQQVQNNHFRNFNFQIDRY